MRSQEVSIPLQNQSDERKTARGIVLADDHRPEPDLNP